MATSSDTTKVLSSSEDGSSTDHSIEVIDVALENLKLSTEQSIESSAAENEEHREIPEIPTASIGDSSSSRNNVLKELTTDPTPSYLYRALSPDENIENGLVPRAPGPDDKVKFYVNYGGKKVDKSQYISTCASLEKAIACGRGVIFLPVRIAVIDRTNLDPGTTVIDLTTSENRYKYLVPSIYSICFAKKYEEVLLQSDKPIPCTLLQEGDTNSAPNTNIVPSNESEATPNANDTLSQILKISLDNASKIS